MALTWICGVDRVASAPTLLGKTAVMFQVNLVSNIVYIYINIRIYIYRVHNNVGVYSGNDTGTYTL